jgi:hypothetical protein
MRTPMSQLQDHFKNLNEIVGSYFNKLELNHADPKYSSFYADGEGGTSKGVDSEFIRIYKPSTNCKNRNTSFAFSFNNYKKNINDTIITVSIKKDKQFETTNVGLDEFRTNFKAYIKMLTILKESNALNGDSIVQSLKAIFPVNTEYVEPDYVSILLGLQKETEQTRSKILEISEIARNQEKELRQTKAAIDAKVEKYRKELEKKEGFGNLQKETTGNYHQVENLKKNVEEIINDKVNSFLRINKNVNVNKFKDNLKDEALKKRKKTETKFDEDFASMVYQYASRN